MNSRIAKRQRKFIKKKLESEIYDYMVALQSGNWKQRVIVALKIYLKEN